MSKVSLPPPGALRSGTCQRYFVVPPDQFGSYAVGTFIGPTVPQLDTAAQVQQVINQIEAEVRRVEYWVLQLYPPSAPPSTPTPTPRHSIQSTRLILRSLSLSVSVSVCVSVCLSQSHFSPFLSVGNLLL